MGNMVPWLMLFNQTEYLIFIFRFAGNIEIGERILVKYEDHLEAQTVIHIHEMDMEGKCTITILYHSDVSVGKGEVLRVTVNSHFKYYHH